MGICRRALFSYNVITYTVIYIDGTFFTHSSCQFEKQVIRFCVVCCLVCQQN